MTKNGIIYKKKMSIFSQATAVTTFLFSMYNVTKLFSFFFSFMAFMQLLVQNLENV